MKGSGKGFLRKAFDSCISSAVDVGKGALRELWKGAADALIGRFVFGGAGDEVRQKSGKWCLGVGGGLCAVPIA